MTTTVVDCYYCSYYSPINTSNTIDPATPDPAHLASGHLVGVEVIVAVVVVVVGHSCSSRVSNSSSRSHSHRRSSGD